LFVLLQHQLRDVGSQVDSISPGSLKDIHGRGDAFQRKTEPVDSYQCAGKTLAFLHNYQILVGIYSQDHSH
jgi:hypothetical protein